MSILDDAIREHLELKRAHGADEAELKRLEDEAFGPPGRPDEPDPLAEAPTEFMATPGASEAVETAQEEGSGRRINIADLQEPPPEERKEEPQVKAADSIAPPEAEAAPPVPAEDAAQAAPPAEEAPAMEHEIVAEPAEPVAEPEPKGEEPGAGAETEERHAIAEQPTELFDVEAEMGSEGAPATEAPSPSDEAIVAAEQEEPRLVPVADDDEEDEEFWSDQRLSDELDQALEAPITDEHAAAAQTDEHEAPAPTAEPSAPVSDHEEEDDSESERPDYDPDTGHEDVLEDTPDFLEDAPEDDDLWFEQRPPKDFDFDD